MRPLLFLTAAVTATLVFADSGESDSGYSEHHRHHHDHHHHHHNDDTIPVDHRQQADKVPNIYHVIPIEQSPYEDTLPPFHKSVPIIKSANSKDCAHQLKQSCPKSCTYQLDPVSAWCDDSEEIQFPNCCVLHLEICLERKNCTILHKKEKWSADKWSVHLKTMKQKEP